MSIFVVRHADKAKGEFRSAGLRMNDQPISEAGKLMAERLAAYFEGMELSSIRVSEYRRTYETIERAAAAKGITPIVDARLNEINVGDTENLTDEELRERFPDFWRAYLERDRDFRFPGGETGEEATARVFELFSSLDRGKNHVLVAHDGVIRCLVCAVLGLSAYKRHLFRIDLCSLTLFEYLDEFACWAIPKINLTL